MQAERLGNEWRIFDLTAQLHDNIRHVEAHFQWHLITADPDDDKFADCAIAAAAEWIVTEDAHFNVLKSSRHKPQPITPGDFIRDVLGNKQVKG